MNTIPILTVQRKMMITAVGAGVEESFCVVNLKDAIVVFIFIVLAFPQFLKVHGRVVTMMLGKEVTIIVGRRMSIA